MIQNQIMAAKFKVTVDENNIKWFESNYGAVKSKQDLEKFRFISNLEKSSLQYAMNFVASRAREMDTSTLDPSEKGVRMIIALNEELQKADNINYKARNISLLTYFEEISRQANVNCYLTSKGVLLCPNGVLPAGIKNKEIKILEVIHTAEEKKEKQK